MCDETTPSIGVFNDRGQSSIGMLMLLGIYLGTISIVFSSIWSVSRAAIAIAANMNTTISLQTLCLHLRKEAHTALAIYVPTSDSLGNPNADGHEFRFVSKNSANQLQTWSYSWDKATGILSRYSISNASATTVTSSKILSLSSFSSTTRYASQINSPLLRSYKIRDVQLESGLSGASAGNAEVLISATSSSATEQVTLLAGTAESGFTIVQALPPGGIPQIPSAPAPSAAEQTNSCNDDLVGVGGGNYVTPPLPGSENEDNLSAQFNHVCSTIGADILIYTAPATPCVDSNGASHPGVTPKVITYPSSITFTIDWTPDGGTSWEYFATETLTNSQGQPSTNCGGYGVQTSTEITYWDGSQAGP